jgi:hypothetical protein
MPEPDRAGIRAERFGTFQNASLAFREEYPLPAFFLLSIQALSGSRQLLAAAGMVSPSRTSEKFRRRRPDSMRCMSGRNAARAG